MQLDELLERLEGVRMSGGNHVARCPAHDDRSPSLSILEGDEGLIITCHAGCDKEAILDSLGLEWRDLFYESEPEATYTYTDEQGFPLINVLRYPGKKFKQQNAQTSEWNLDGVRRVLYHLPEVLYGRAQGKTIYICEGEKDAERIRGTGRVATTTVGGAQSWKDEYAEVLRGARVIVVQDKDEPGRKRAQQIKQSLEAVAGSVHIVQAKEGKDASDHLDAGYAVQDFEIVNDGDGVVVPIRSVQQFAAAVKPYNTEQDYLGPLLHGGNRVHIAGPSGHGKTTFMLEMEAAALQGKDFLGWQGRGAVTALHIDLEMPEQQLHRAVSDAGLIDHDGFHLWHAPDGLAIDKNEHHRAQLEKAVEGYDIVCIDPFYKLVEDEGDYAGAREVIGLLDSLRARHPRMAMLVGYHSHQPKDRNQRINLSNIQGFKKWHYPAEIVFTFQRLAGDYSRLVWAKDRPGRLGVSLDEEWALKWSRGDGFFRIGEEELAMVMSS